jgi:hypothetical protein
MQRLKAPSIESSLREISPGPLRLFLPGEPRLRESNASARFGARRSFVAAAAQEEVPMGSDNIWLAQRQTSPYGLSPSEGFCDAEMGPMPLYRFK